jgi:hypothetical protein
MPKAIRLGGLHEELRLTAVFYAEFHTPLTQSRRRNRPPFLPISATVVIGPATKIQESCSRGRIMVLLGKACSIWLVAILLVEASYFSLNLLESILHNNISGTIAKIN